MSRPFEFVKPHECGTFTLTDEEKRAICAAADDARQARAASMPTDLDAVRVIANGVQRLEELGWREAMYAPKDGTLLLLIEPGSMGIHTGYRDDIGFWIVDDDTWPSHPILWRTK